MRISNRRGLSYYLPLRIDRYVLGEIVGPFLGGNIFFIFIFLMFQALKLAEFFIVHGVSAFTLGKMTMLMALSFIPSTLPAAFLISVLVGFGRLSSDSELVAMKSNGLSLPRLSLSVVGLSLVVVLVSVFLNMEWVPWGARQFKQTLIKVSNTKVVSSIQEGTFTSCFFDLLIFAEKVDTKTSQLSRVFIYDEREPKNPLAVVARTGEILSVRTDSDLGAAAVLKLNDGSIHRNDATENTYQKIKFGEYRLFLKVDEGTGDNVTKPHQLTYHELLEKIRTSDPASPQHREWNAEYWRRYSVAITPLIMTFLGIGFGTVRTRAVRAGAVLIALITMAGYWLLQTAGSVLVGKDWISPFLAMQLPNVVMLIVAVYVFRKSTW
jgi:lipopolysaccharide export system permease protein